MNDIAPTWQDALVMLSGFACLAFRHFVIRSAEIHWASSHKGEKADRSTAEMRFFTNSGQKIIA
jgi:hypothetical protein